MTHYVVPSVNIFILKDTKVLLGRRVNTGWMDGSLCPPGGHVEIGETPLNAAVREIEEELGVTINPVDLEFLCVAARNMSPNEYVGYEFIIRNKDYDYSNNEPDKCSELIWVELSDLSADVIDHFRQVIERSILGDEKYLELSY